MNSKVGLIKQALSAAEQSIRLANQLLAELEGGREPQVIRSGREDTQVYGVIEKPGVIGVFDGEGMVTQKGENYPVPANYASKSMLVVGDTLKMVDENGEKRFKQVEHVKRHRTEGILTKKDGKFRVVTPEGSYKVLPVSIEHYKGEVGDRITAYLPAGNLTAAYVALESVTKKSADTVEEEVIKETPNNGDGRVKEEKLLKRTHEAVSKHQEPLPRPELSKKEPEESVPLKNKPELEDRVSGERTETQAKKNDKKSSEEQQKTLVKEEPNVPSPAGKVKVSEMAEDELR